MMCATALMIQLYIVIQGQVLYDEAYTMHQPMCCAFAAAPCHTLHKTALHWASAQSAVVYCRFRKVLVADIIHQHKAVRSNNPVYIWQGGFREVTSCKDPEQALWKPSGFARPSSREGY